MKKALLRSSCVAAALAVLAGVGYVTASPGAFKAPNRAEDIEPAYDAPTALSAQKTVSGIQLKWKSPQERFNQLRVTESFESYERGEYQNLSPWTLIDEDGLPSAATLDKIPSGTIYAWGVSGDKNYVHSGDQSLATMYRKNAGQSLDWLISPVLNFGGQTITFWATSNHTQYLESLEVRYSTGDAWLPDLMANEPLLTVDAVPVAWTQYTVDIPAEARHFAIRCTSTDKSTLYIDDIIYWPGSLDASTDNERELGIPYEKLLGFNLYRNGDKMNDEPVFANEYLDQVEPGAYTYIVKAVYEDADGQPVESEASNAASVNVEVADMKYPAPLNLQGVSSVDGVSLSWEHPVFDGSNLVPYTQTFDGTESGDDPLLDVEGKIQAETYNGLRLVNRNGQSHYQQGEWPWKRSATRGVKQSGCLLTDYVDNQYAHSDSWIITPKLNGRPQTVTFEYKNADDNDPETFEVLYTTDIQDLIPDGISMDEYGVWTLVESVVATGETWKTMSVELPEGATYFAIRCTSGYCYTFFVDNLTYTPYELPADAAPTSAPARVMVPMTGYNVYRDGVKINTTPVVDPEYLDEDVTPGTELSYTVTAVYGSSGESAPSEETKVVVLADPAPENISAVLTSTGIAVEWNAPDLSYRNTTPITEDFESFSKFAFGGEDAINDYEVEYRLGDWRLVNRAEKQHNDKQRFLPWYVDNSDNNICLSTNYIVSGDKQQDEWIISPLLSGARQSVSLDVKAKDDSYGPEVLQLLYTTADECDVPEGKDLEEYGVWTVVDTRDITNTSWETISFDIPAGSTHFALRCLSKDKFTLSIDNISYADPEPRLPQRALRQLKGYNVYVGGEMINTSPITDTSFHIPAPGFGDHQITVAAVYANSEVKADPHSISAHPSDIHLPAVKVVDGSAANGAVSLTWMEPEVPEIHEFIEDFSSATEQADVVDSFNGWTAINANGETHIHNGLSFWEQGENPWYIELDEDSDSENPNYYLANGYSNAGIDDWFISPRASGVKSVQFDARITMLGYPDVIQVLATQSQDCTDLSSYTLVQTAAPKSITDWTNYSIDLPEGTTYFALRSYNVAKDGMHIDNIAWQREILAAEGFIGYNLYRKYTPIEEDPENQPAEAMARTRAQAEDQDFVKINDKPITDASYSEVLDPGDYHYLISALYPWGESEMSPVFTVRQNTGIENLKTDNASEADAVYYTVDGIRVDNPRAGSVYIEVRGGKAKKVFVK